MRMLLLTAGSRGDVEPFAALARRAQRRGHEVALVAPDRSGADLDGLDVRSIGVDYGRLIAQQGVSPLAAMGSMRTVVRPLMRAVIVESTRVALDHRPDVVIAHPKVLSAPLAAAALGVPFVLVEIVPSMTPTRAFPAAGTLARGIPALNRLTYRAAGAASAMFRAELEEAAALTGRPRPRSEPPAATLVPIGAALLERPGDWPPTIHLTGAWHDGRQQGSDRLPQQVAELLEGGDVVYAGFGSMAAGDAAERARSVIGAARAVGARTLIATGLGGLRVPSDLAADDDVLVVPSTSHDAVLPRVRAVVHHGGIGTVHAALRAATPSVIVPFIADQPFWGARLHERGLGPAPIARRRLTVGALATALSGIERHEDALHEAASTMSREDGLGAAIATIERLA